ncbi:GNAT family N-acetyltransferase [Streptomyces malaysiensis]|uniref:GNAT family N-acetyltransferase n=1 Tax=Streptomyces malaysiensis subsp. samsunensis TaxID=459658 RepID=A0A9X2RUH5_STRMQ|nr:GNAT family N-acetyltransferase [Streptomyces samsunensis]MCQ8828779.1 GNAT family N-acetyltransferase [Streptomyces samsunensis]
MTTISVRPLDTEDWALYRAVRLAALADAPEAFGSTLGREQAFTADIWRGRLTKRNQFVAEDAGEACGLIGIVPAEPGVAELVSMWVHPAARGRGAGDLLVREALRWAKDQHLPEVRLWVADGNESAERLYARHGFQRTGQIQPVREGEDELEFAMARSERPRPMPRIASS